MPVTISRRDRTGGFRHGGEFRVGEREGHRVSHFHFCLVAKMVPTRVGTSGLTLLGCGNRLQRKRFETTETKRQQFLQDFATFSRATRFAEWFAEGAGQIDAARRRLPWRQIKRPALRATASEQRNARPRFILQFGIDLLGATCILGTGGREASLQRVALTRIASFDAIRPLPQGER